MLTHFRTIRDGSLVGRFLTIKQESTVEKYRNRFDKYLTPMAFLQTIALEETFMNGLYPWLKTKVSVLEPVGLAQTMKLALKMEHKEMVRREVLDLQYYISTGGGEISLLRGETRVSDRLVSDRLVNHINKFVKEGDRCVSNWLGRDRLVSHINKFVRRGRDMDFFLVIESFCYLLGERETDDC